MSIIYPTLITLIVDSLDPSSVEGDPGSFAWPPVWQIVGCVLVIIALLALWMVVKGHSTRLDKHKDYLVKLDEEVLRYKSSIGQQYSAEDIKSMVRHLMDSNPAVDRLAGDVRGLADRLSRLERGSMDNSQQHQQPVNDFRQNSPEIFYMSYPVQNHFLQQASSSVKENTMYRFQLRPSGTEAEFELHTEGVPISNIIGGVERYIRPACIERNSPKFNSSHIKTHSPGLASLQGDRWLIEKKAEISYE